MLKLLILVTKFIQFLPLLHGFIFDFNNIDINR